MSYKTLKVDELRVGMYLNLPSTLESNPFPENQFRIQSLEQIEQIRALGLDDIAVDLSQSHLTWLAGAPAKPLLDPRDGEVPPLWTPENLVPAELADAIGNLSLPPRQKSQAVYRHSSEMMRRLLEQPSAENLQESKKAIGSIADMILGDDHTSAQLLYITAHDFYTYTHSVNVGVTALIFAKYLFAGSDDHDLQELGAGFFLHDLGKVRVPNEIINKPGRLTEEEMRVMRTHPYQGYKILEQAGALTEECRVIVMQHHENNDGSGYPRRLKGDEIHLYGHICGIADVYDALTAERSYKQAMKPFDALRLMKEQMRHRFDEQLFQSFVRMFETTQRLLK
jgi:HD-GYP domain-containing protein (c-di-GMP phosphodiesterase class II)